MPALFDWRAMLVPSALLYFCTAGAQEASPTAPIEYRREAPLPLQQSFHTVSPWKVTVTASVAPTHEIGSDNGRSVSQICFDRQALAPSSCTYFSALFNSPRLYQVFLGFSVERLTRRLSTATGLIMKARAWYSTGQVQEMAIWVYNVQRDEFELAVAVPSSQEQRIFNSGYLDGALVTVNWYWANHENRWSDHRRNVTVYRYRADKGIGTYRKVLEYTTIKKYRAEDSSTIDAELVNIESKLRK
jgi:hypothetical protein